MNYLKDSPSGSGLLALANWSPDPSSQDTAEYVAYVAKDPVNQRGEACGQHWVGPII